MEPEPRDIQPFLVRSLGLPPSAPHSGLSCGWPRLLWLEAKRQGTPTWPPLPPAGVCGSTILCLLRCPPLLLVSFQRWVTQRNHRSCLPLAARMLPRSQTLFLQLLDVSTRPGGCGRIVLHILQTTDVGVPFLFGRLGKISSRCAACGGGRHVALSRNALAFARDMTAMTAVVLPLSSCALAFVSQ